MKEMQSNQKISISDTYTLAAKVKSKLTSEALRADTNLFRLVTQANLLDHLIDCISTCPNTIDEPATVQQQASTVGMPKIKSKITTIDEEDEEAHVKFNLPSPPHHPRTVVREIHTKSTPIDLDEDKDAEYDYDNDYDFEEEIIYHSIYSSSSDTETDSEDVSESEEYYFEDEGEEEDNRSVHSQREMDLTDMQPVQRFKLLPSLHLDHVDLNVGIDVEVEELSDYTSDEEELDGEVELYPNLIYTSSISDDEDVDVDSYDIKQRPHDAEIETVCFKVGRLFIQRAGEEVLV